jgi:DNA-binding MarR family transcriptional regulator
MPPVPVQHESLGRSLGILYRRRDRFFEEQLRPYGIGPGPYRLLMSLYHHAREGSPGPVSQTELGSWLGLDKGAVARSMGKLEDQGYVRRERSASDGREYCITLTAKALGLKDGMAQVRRRWIGILERGFSAEERRMAVAYLRRMAANADEALVPGGEEGGGGA